MYGIKKDDISGSAAMIWIIFFNCPSRIQQCFFLLKYAFPLSRAPTTHYKIHRKDHDWIILPLHAFTFMKKKITFWLNQSHQVDKWTWLRCQKSKKVWNHLCLYQLSSVVWLQLLCACCFRWSPVFCCPQCYGRVRASLMALFSVPVHHLESSSTVGPPITNSHFAISTLLPLLLEVNKFIPTAVIPKTLDRCVKHESNTTRSFANPF